MIHPSLPLQTHSPPSGSALHALPASTRGHRRPSCGRYLAWTSAGKGSICILGGKTDLPTSSHETGGHWKRAGHPLTSIPSLHVEDSWGEKTCRQFTVSLSNSTTSVSHSMESVSMAESWELWAISCRNRASFSNWDSICSLRTKRESWQRPSGRQSIPAKSTGKQGGPCPAPLRYTPAS